MKTLAQAIPAKFRTAIYSALGTLIGLEAIFDVVPSPLDGKIIAALAVLGFGTAALNVTPATPAE